MNPKTRATAIWIEDDKILLVEQKVSDSAVGHSQEELSKYEKLSNNALSERSEKKTGLKIGIEQLCIYVTESIMADM